MADFQSLSRSIADAVLATAAVRVVGIGGGQGAGKSTLAAQVVTEICARGHRAAQLSLDDFYLTHAQRAALARDVHPLLATRGVPGSHDIDALVGAALALRRPGRVPVPQFDKGADDRLGEMRIINGDCRMVVVEGWCIGARPQPPDDLVAPVNALEATEDADGVWRRWVNVQLAAYQRLNDLIDFLVFLDVGDMQRVLKFRAQQEAGLEPGRRMAAPALDRFVAHYERITTWMRADVPARADLVVDLGDAHEVRRLHDRRSSSVQPPGATVLPDC